MVLLGYFYREAREAASIDAAWRMATEALGVSPSTKPSTSSVGTTAIKSSTATGSSTSKPIFQPHPTLSRSSTTSTFTSISRQATTTIASAVGLSSISDITFTSSSDGSLFEFSEAERQKARAILNHAASASAASSSSSSSSSLFSGPTTGNLTASRSSSTNSSPDLLARGRSSSVWSSAASVTSVTQRNRLAAHREDVIW